MDRKPVVFIPGLPATELIYEPEKWRLFPPSLADLRDKAKKKRLLELLADPANPDVVAGKPILNILGITKQAESLYDFLGRIGYDTSENSKEFEPVGWDWRHSVDDKATAKRVIAAIDRLFKASGRKVVVLVHSTGGLVFRSVWEKNADKLRDKIEQVLAFGVPWAGTLKSLHAMTEGEAVGLPLIGGLVGRITAEESKGIMRRAAAAYDLCPPDPNQSDIAGLDLFMSGGQQAGPLVDVSWIKAGAEFDFMRTEATRANAAFGKRSRTIDGLPPMTNVVGWGRKTLKVGTLTNGKVKYEEGDQGDSTVPFASASWIEGATVRTLPLPIGVYPMDRIPNPHPRIWDSPPVAQIFSEVLLDQPRRPFVAVAADGDQSLDRTRKSVTLRITAADVNGKALPNAKATVTLNGRAKTNAFGDATRLDVTVERRGLRSNVPPDLFRFEVEVAWDFRQKEEPEKRVVLIRV